MILGQIFRKEYLEQIQVNDKKKIDDTICRGVLTCANSWMMPCLMVNLEKL